VRKIGTKITFAGKFFNYSIALKKLNQIHSEAFTLLYDARFS
jgi:hypothetical protein